MMEPEEGSFRNSPRTGELQPRSCPAIPFTGVIRSQVVYAVDPVRRSVYIQQILPRPGQSLDS